MNYQGRKMSENVGFETTHATIPSICIYVADTKITPTTDTKTIPSTIINTCSTIHVYPTNSICSILACWLAACLPRLL